MSNATSHIDNKPSLQASHCEDEGRSKRKQPHSLVPELRFKEFEGEWSKKKLSKVCQVNPKAEKLPNSFIYVDLESVKKGVLGKEERINKIDAPSRAQRLLIKNDILYQTVRPYQKNNYFFSKNNLHYVASTGYAQIRTDNSAHYIFQLLHTELFVNKVLLRCTGTSYPAINSSDLKSIPINIPTLPEQQKIASFLSVVDEKIQQLTKKKALLEHYKKGVMQQLFSGVLRFKDENGEAYPDWVEKRLGEIVSISSGISPSSYELKEEGSIPFLKVEELNNCSKYQLISRFYAEQGRNIVPKGSVVFPKRGAAILNNKVRITAVDAFMDSNLMALQVDKDSDNEFLYYFLIKKQLFKIADTSTIPQINNKHIEPYPIRLPSVKEQQKIASYLSGIDTKIEAVTHQITQTQAFKKGLLQQMFV